VKVLNYTGHPVTLYGDDGRIVQLEPLGRAIIPTKQKVSGHLVIDGRRFPIMRTEYSDRIEGLPDPNREEEIYYITSIVVARLAAYFGRHDVLAVGEKVRVNGTIKAKSFQKFN
jgi:hypothetical protein